MRSGPGQGDNMACAFQRGFKEHAIVGPRVFAKLGLCFLLTVVLGCISPRLPGADVPFEGVRLERDIVYALGAVKKGAKTRPLTLDAYLPEKPVTGAPALIMIHGGGFRFGDKAEPQFGWLGRISPPVAKWPPFTPLSWIPRPPSASSRPAPRGLA